MSSVKSDCLSDLYLDKENGDYTSDVNLAFIRSLSRLPSSSLFKTNPITSLSQLKIYINIYGSFYSKILSGAKRVWDLETNILKILCNTSSVNSSYFSWVNLPFST